MDKETAINKIIKLLALADPSRGGMAEEVDTAMQMANKLMKEHNLVMADVTKNEDTFNIFEFRVKAPKNLWAWEQRLSIVFEYLCDVKTFVYRRQNTKTIVFVGLETDVNLASTMYNIFRKQIHSNGRKFGNHKDYRSYGEGYVYALVSRAREMKANRYQKTETQALVFVGKKESAIQTFYNSLGLKKAKTTQVKVTDAFFKGKMDGNAVDLGLGKNLVE